MFFLNQYEQKVVKYDLINKFKYNTVDEIPILASISLNFRLKRFNVKNLISAISSLKVLTSQNSIFLKSQVPNIVLKIRKGHPIGCKVTLRKNLMNKFLFKLSNKMLLKSKTEITNNTIHIKINNILIFTELEKNYQFFKNLTDLHIYIKTTKCQLNEFLFLTNAYKL